MIEKCDECGVWHSISCCHPGRAKYAALEAEKKELEARIERAIAHDEFSSERSRIATEMVAILRGEDREQEEEQEI